jgi:hypothetical protein
MSFESRFHNAGSAAGANRFARCAPVVLLVVPPLGGLQGLSAAFWA